MEAKYNEAIKAGVIGGVILAVLELINQFSGLIDLNSMSSDAAVGVGLCVLGLCCCLFILYIIVLLGIGVLAVRMARPVIMDTRDAIVVSALAGAVGGLIWGVVGIILRFLMPLISPSYSGEYNELSNRVGGSLVSGICGVVCCLPTALVLGIVMAVIGGAIYAVLVPKK